MVSIKPAGELGKVLTQSVGAFAKKAAPEAGVVAKEVSAAAPVLTTGNKAAASYGQASIAVQEKVAARLASKNATRIPTEVSATGKTKAEELSWTNARGNTVVMKLRHGEIKELKELAPNGAKLKESTAICIDDPGVKSLLAMDSFCGSLKHIMSDPSAKVVPDIMSSSPIVRVSNKYNPETGLLVRKAMHSALKGESNTSGTIKFIPTTDELLKQHNVSRQDVKRMFV